VFQKREPISTATVRRDENETPRSPRRRFVRYAPY
jgi:hypothetical protein